MRDAGRESRVPAGPFLVVGNDFELLDRRGAVYPEVALFRGHTSCWPLFAIRSILLVGILTKHANEAHRSGLLVGGASHSRGRVAVTVNRLGEWPAWAVLRPRQAGHEAAVNKALLCRASVRWYAGSRTLPQGLSRSPWRDSR